MRRHDEQGTVLLTTLLVMALMATLAVSLMDDIRLAVKRTQTVDAYAQADWQLLGGQAFVTAWIENDYKTLPLQAKTAILTSPDPLILPTPGGAVTVRLRDATQCFNLNAVVGLDGKAVEGPRLEFIRLLNLLGLPQRESEALSERLVDWIDSDTIRSANGAEDGTYLRRTPPYRTANTALTSVDELLAIDGIDAETFELLKPFICIGAPGELMPVNINTLPPDRMFVLAAAIGGDRAVATAQAILSDRGPAPMDDLVPAQSLIQGGDEAVSESQRIAIQSDAIFAEVIVTQTRGATTAERVRVYRYDGVATDTPKLTYRGWGRAAFFPDAPKADDEEGNDR